MTTKETLLKNLKELNHERNFTGLGIKTHFELYPGGEEDDRFLNELWMQYIENPHQMRKTIGLINERLLIYVMLFPK